MRIAFAFLALVVFTACFPALPTSEHATLVLPSSGLFDPTSLNGGAGAGNVIAGTKLCPNVGHVEPGPNVVDVSACFASSVDGPAQADGDGCITFGGEGDVTWTFTPLPCTAPKDFRPVVDDFKFHAVAPEHVHLAAFAPLDIAAVRSLGGNVALVSPAALPAGFEHVDALFANRALHPTLGFVDDTGGIVQFNRSDATISLAGDGALLLDDDAATPIVQAAAGADLELAMTIANHTFAAPALAVDDANDVASLEPVVFAFGEDANRAKNGLPIVRAFVEDHAARVVAGAPVEWRILRAARRRRGHRSRPCSRCSGFAAAR